MPLLRYNSRVSFVSGVRQINEKTTFLPAYSSISFLVSSNATLHGAHQDALRLMTCTFPSLGPIVLTNRLLFSSDTLPCKSFGSPSILDEMFSGLTMFARIVLYSCINLSSRYAWFIWINFIIIQFYHRFGQEKNLITYLVFPYKCLSSFTIFIPLLHHFFHDFIPGTVPFTIGTYSIIIN